MKDVRQRLKSSLSPLNGPSQEGQLCRYGLDCRVCGATVLFATPGVNQTEKPLRLVGYTVDGTKYRVATSPYDLTAEQIAFIYKLRWDIEKFFAWRKRHLRVYHLIARSQYGLIVQTLSGLITYLLLAIYFREQHNKKVSIKRAGNFVSRYRMRPVSPTTI